MHPEHREISIDYTTSGATGNSMILGPSNLNQRRCEECARSHETIDVPQHVASKLPLGLTFRIILADVKSTKTVNVALLANHAMYHASSINRRAKDLGRLNLRCNGAEGYPTKPS